MNLCNFLFPNTKFTGGGVMKKFGIILGLVFLGVFLIAYGCQKKGGETQETPAVEDTAQSAVQQPTSPLTGITTDMLASDECPVSGKELTNETIVDTVIYNGKMYGFCSKEDKAKFKADPEKYISMLESKAKEEPEGKEENY